MRILDPTAPLFRAMLPAGVYSSQYLPGQNAAGADPDFASGILFDVSAWDSWMVTGELFPAAPDGLLIFTYYDSIERPNAIGFPQRQTLRLPTDANSFMVVGRTLGPLVSVAFAGTLAGDSELDVFMSNRTRIYDAPYTPIALGTVLASVARQSVAPATALIVDLPYYLGPARLGGYFGAAASNLAVALVRDDEAAFNTLGSIDASSPIAELWIPGLVDVGVASTWQLEVANSTAGALTLAASLTAA